MSEFPSLDLSVLDKNGRYFIEKVYSSGITKYINRIESIGLIGDASVLDAGCGFGQWSIALSRLNRRVFAVDVDPVRLGIASKIAQSHGCLNAEFCQASVDELPLCDDSVDVVFSYSVLYLTDPRKSLLEFSRVLKPGGVLYLVTNGIGWYLKSVLEPMNVNAQYDPRQIGARAFHRAITRSAGLSDDDSAHQILSSEDLSRLLEESGFSLDYVGPEGSFRRVNTDASWSVYEERYLGFENVLEVLGTKTR